ncbi:MAG: patatin-like phospholipase family protein [Deltaproteobacteria bacterium]|nr:patatin-like phospholipase family protein [Deltaproteobacteria bacterium]
MSSRTLTVGLALGGGAALGLAHVGVLKVLERERIPVHLITGTSMGALVGALYATHVSAAEVERRLREYIEGPLYRQQKFEFLKERSAERRSSRLSSLARYLKRNFLFGLSIARGSFISEAEVRRTLELFVSHAPISSTRIRFFPIAADLVSGQEQVLEEGSLLDAVAASCAIPGLFAPVRTGTRVLIDGSWIDTVPTVPAYARGAEFVIGVDVDKPFEPRVEYTTGLDVVLRSSDVTRYALKRLQLARADQVIRVPLEDVFWGDFGRIGHIVERGEQAAEAALPEPLAALRKARWKKWLRNPVGRAFAERATDRVSTR